jgi:quercetin 2,3-dioxygenase
VVRGIVALDGTEMREGAGAAVEEQPSIATEAETEAEILLFDLA